MKLLKFLLVLLSILACSKEKASDDNIETPEIVIPVKIYNYNFTYATDLSSSYDKSEIYACFDKVNQIWKQARIRFKADTFTTVNINDTVFSNNSYENMTNRQFRLKLDELSVNYIPVHSFSKEGVLTLVLIEKFPHPAAGVWSKQTEIVFFAKTKNNQNVVKNILAHEFGHALGLHHVDAAVYPDNLMKAGDNHPETAGTLLEDQIEMARRQALIYLNN